MLDCEAGGRWARRWLAVLAVAVSFGCFAAQASAFVYWGHSNAIGRARIDGSHPDQSFITGINSLGLALNGQYIYWADPTLGIGRANLDGSGSPDQTFVTGLRPVGVAVDSNYIYWTSPGNYQVGTGTIGRANLDGSNPDPTFITGLNAPLGIAVDGQHIYWANEASGAIGRANLDGTGANASFITGTGQLFGVAINGQYIYWTNTGSIGRANIDGTNPNQSLVTGMNGVSLAVDGQHIYWANQSGGGSPPGSDTIGRANLDGTSPDENFITGISGVFGVAVDQGYPGIATPSARSVTFPTQPLDTLSPPQTLTITNTGGSTLDMSSTRFTAGDTDDFLLTTDTCSGVILQRGAACALHVRFAPAAASAPNALSAVLTITSDDPASPLSVIVQGTGGPLPQGPPGPAGPSGKSAATGPRGIVHCHVTKHGHGDVLICVVAYRHRQHKAIRATLMGANHTYVSTITRGGTQLRFVLRARRRLAHGRYTLTFRVAGRMAQLMTLTL